ncbi:MAG: HEAT repeat domain-containing protein, partial [Candidatus Omnitrophica bacterium]|nr:HEAT repeat domain-containing protein [Candidatus Omnitrophota bacterium]
LLGEMMHFNPFNDVDHNHFKDLAAGGLNVGVGGLVGLALNAISPLGTAGVAIIMLSCFATGTLGFVIGHHTPWERMQQPEQSQKDGGTQAPAENNPGNIISRPLIALWESIYNPIQARRYIKILGNHNAARNDRENAAKMLGKLKDQSAIDPLYTYLVEVALGDDYDMINPAVENSLKQLGQNDRDIETILLDVYLLGVYKGNKIRPLIQMNALRLLGDKYGNSLSRDRIIAAGEIKGDFKDTMTRAMNKAFPKIFLRAQHDDILLKDKREAEANSGKTGKVGQDGGTAYKIPLRLIQEMAKRAMDKSTFPDVVKALTDPNSLVRHNALKRLERFGELTPEMKLIVLVELLSHPNSKVRSASAEELDKLGKLTKELKIIRYVADLSDPDKAIRIKAAEALGEIGEPHTVDPLLIALKDNRDDDVVRRAIVVALGKIGHPRAIPYLQAISVVNFSFKDRFDIKDRLDVKYRYDAVIALRTLVRLPVEKKIPLFIEDLTYLDEEVRIFAIYGLIEIGQPAVEPLVKKLATSNKVFLRNATAVLAKIGQPAIAPLFKALHEPMNSDIRLAAAEILSEIGGMQVIEPLIYALYDPFKEVGRAAAAGLVKIGMPAVPKLMGLSRDPTIGEQATNILTRISANEAAKKAQKDGGTAMTLGTQWQEAWFNLQQAFLSRVKLPESEWKTAVEEAQKKVGVIAGGISQARQFKEQQPVTMAELQRERVYISATKIDQFNNPQVFSGEEIIAQYGPLTPDFTGMEEGVKTLSLHDVIAVLQDMGQMEKPRQYNDSGVSLRDGGVIQKEVLVAEEITINSPYARALIAGELLKSLYIHSNRYDLESVTDVEKDLFDKIKGNLVVADFRKRGKYVFYKTNISEDSLIFKNNPILWVSSDKGENRSFSPYSENGWRVYWVNPSAIMLDSPFGQFKISRRAQYKVWVEKWDGVISEQSITPMAAAKVAAQDGGFMLSDYPSLRIDDILFRADELFKREKDPADKEITKLASAKIYEIGPEAYPVLKKRLADGSINERHKGIAQEALKMLQTTYQLGKDGGDKMPTDERFNAWDTVGKTKREDNDKYSGAARESSSSSSGEVNTGDNNAFDGGQVADEKIDSLLASLKITAYTSARGIAPSSKELNSLNEFLGKKDLDREARLKIISFMGNLKHIEDKEIVMQPMLLQLEKADPEIRMAVITSVLKMGDTVIDALVGLLNQEKLPVFASDPEAVKRVIEVIEKYKNSKDGGQSEKLDNLRELLKRLNSGLGGVDFRAMPVATGVVPLVVPGANAMMPKVSLEELDNQWKEIQHTAQNAELPYQKLKQFVSCCRAQEEAAGLKQEVIAYVANLLKLEEERAISTPSQLKEIVALVAA